jgi:signal transduction histidine kinase
VINTLLQGAESGKKLYILSNPGYKSTTETLLIYDLVQRKLVGYGNQLQILDMFSLPGHEIWISTPTGLHLVDSVRDKDLSVALKPLPDSLHIPKNIVPNLVYKDRQGNFWLADVRGIFRITQTGKTTAYTDKNGLTTNFQTSIFQDYENNMWFTNEQTGLCKFSNPELAYYPVFRPGFNLEDIFIGPNSDSVWLYAGHDRLALLLLPNGRSEQLTHQEPVSDYARFVSANNQYILNGRSILRLTPAGKNNSYHASVCYSDTSTPVGITSAIRDNNGRLLAVSDRLVVVSDNKTMTQPLGYMADQLTIDTNNRIWIAARSNNLFCFEVSGSGNQEKLTLLRRYFRPFPGSPRSIAADHSGNLWIGTRDQGLYCLKLDGLYIKSIKQLTTADGLSENFINYLYCDKDDNIWACTLSGLDKVTRQGKQFSVENLTRKNNLYLPILKIQQTDKGMFWILTKAGIVTYNPVRSPVSGWRPQLLLSQIIVNNTANEHIAAHDLKYFQNNISFQFSAPSYVDEKQTRFSYLLEGSGNEYWSAPSPDASINFINLRPGDYTLRAKAIFLHGLYPPTESAFSFTILPPWWQTWWFKSLVGIFVLGLLLFALRFYINRKLELQRVMLERRRAIEKERTRIATDMHDDLGAGLSQIKFLSEAIGMKKQQHLPIEEEISHIRTFSVEMIEKMGEIVWALNEKNDTLSDLLSYTRSYAVEYLEQNGIECKVDEPDNIPQDYVSSEFRRNVYLTVKEALHNIVKHAQATHVHINIQITDQLSILIRDNGIGIDNSAPRIHGNGLLSMNARIRELNGCFEISNNNGTEVKIQVPLT